MYFSVKRVVLKIAEVELGEEREKHVEIREELIKAADAERKVLSYY